MSAPLAALLLSASASLMMDYNYNQLKQPALSSPLSAGSRIDITFFHSASNCPLSFSNGEEEERESMPVTKVKERKVKRKRKKPNGKYIASLKAGCRMRRSKDNCR